MDDADEKAGNNNKAGIIRPLLVIAVFFALGTVLGRYAHLQAIYISAAAVSSVAAFVYYVRKRQISSERGLKRKIIIILVCAASIFLAAYLSAAAYDVSYVKTGEGIRIEGRVYNQPYNNDYGSTVCLLDEARAGGSKCGNIKLYVSAANTVKCGDVISATADVEVPKGVRNPGGFDEKLYLLSQGVSYKAYADTVQVIGNKSGPIVFFTQTRKFLGDTIDDIFEADTAPVAKAMLLGDTQGIDEQTYTAFKDTGMAHVLAVSGLNASILIAFIYFLLKALKVGRTSRLIAALLFVAVYTCVTGLTPSIVRAAIMAGALLTGTYFGKQTDTLNYFSLAFIISLILWPLDLFSVSFQLSYGAIFGILTLGWQIKRWWDKALSNRLSRTGNALSASIGATAGTAPILAATFNRVSTLSIIINIFVIPLASAATVLVFISALFGLILGHAAAFAAFPAAIVIRLMLLLINWGAGIPFIAFNIASPPVYFVLAWFLILFISSKYLLIKTKLKAVISGALCAIVVLAMLSFQFKGMYMAFLDVGQADSAFIKTEQGGQYFIDGGRESNSQEVVSFTIRNGYSPGAAFVSHTDTDHFSGIVALYNAGLLKKVYCSWQEEDAVRSAMPDIAVVPLSAGDTVMLDEYTKALVLYPYKDTVADGENDISLVLLLDYKGHRTLFTGDMSGETETQVFALLPKVDIYKAAHHGSKGSSYRLPLSVIAPDFSVISVGKNTYGQPDPHSLANLEYYSGKVYNTIDDYAVEFYIRSDIKVNTYGR